MAHDQLVESARRRVKELEGQVDLLNAHATQMGKSPVLFIGISAFPTSC
jgi:hypothetical protein